MDERKNDYDLQECLKYAPFKLEEIETVLACVPGEADGYSWHYIVKLTDGKFGYVHGGCDFTGWGCQESGGGFKENMLEEVLAHVPEVEGYDEEYHVRALLHAQIDGKKPYGMREAIKTRL